MNILNKIAEKRYEEATHLVLDLVRNGKLLYDAAAEVEQYMCNRYGKNWRMGMPNYSSKPQPKRKSFIQRIKDFFGHHE